MSMENERKKELIEYAKLAEQTERYDDMASTMKEVIETSTEKLLVEERNLFSVAYKNIAGAKRSAWRVITSMESKNEGLKKAVAEEFKKKVVEELLDICKEVFELIEKYLLTKVRENVKEDAEDVVFYLKMQGDYHRYAAEVSQDVSRQDQIKLAGESYKNAYKIDMAPTDPVRLGLVLNYSVFFYEMTEEVQKACQLAKESFDEAIKKLDSLPEESYKDSTLIMQLLRDNLTLWTSEHDNEEEEAD